MQLLLLPLLVLVAALMVMGVVPSSWSWSPPAAHAFVVPSAAPSSPRAPRCSAPSPLQIASLPNPFGGGKAGKAAAAPSSSMAAGSVVPGVSIQEVTANELRLAARVCIYAFFDTEPGKLMANPIKSMQLASLEDEQLRDLRSRFGGRRLGRSVMLKAVDDASESIVGFVELRVRSDLKYGLGPDVKPRDERPYLANLAVLPSARRRGIARALVKAGEALVQSWGYDELILQVEASNAVARRLYLKMGYVEKYTDPAGKKYELDGMKIKSVRCRKVGMRKQLGGGGGGGGGNMLGGLLGQFFGKG